MGASPPSCAAAGAVYTDGDPWRYRERDLDPADAAMLRGIGGSSFQPVFCNTVTYNDLLVAGRKVAVPDSELCRAVRALPRPYDYGADSVGGNDPLPDSIVDPAIKAWLDSIGGGVAGEQGYDEVWDDPGHRYHAAHIGVASAAGAYCFPVN